jgi:hypothetical protein
MARSLQQLGFTLDEIIDALRAHDAGQTREEDQLWRLEAVIDRVDAKHPRRVRPARRDRSMPFPS